MARQSVRFFHYLSLCILAFGIFLGIGKTAMAQAPSPGQLVHQGFSYLDQGQGYSAWQSWHQAELAYARQGDRDGVQGSQINQSIAQQSLGQDISACYSVTHALRMPNLCDQVRQNQVDLGVLKAQAEAITSEPGAIGLRVLGDNLRDLGQFEAGAIVLNLLTKGKHSGSVWLSLGQLYQAQGNHTGQAVQAYQWAIAQGEDAETTVSAKLGLLAMRISELSPQEIQGDIQAIDFFKLSKFKQAQAHLYLAKFLTHQATAALAEQQAKAALEVEDGRTQAIAHQRLAEAQCLMGRDCLELAEKASALGRSVEAWDVVYQAEALVGKLYSQAGQWVKAGRAYGIANASLQVLRRDLQGVPASIQLDFAKQVEPVYRGYLDVLFKQGNTEGILEVSSQLQIAELENFLGCRLNDWQPIYKLEASPGNTLIFVVRGTDQFLVIVQAPNRQRFSYAVEAGALEGAIENLLINVQSPGFMRIDPNLIKRYGQRLYSLILGPAVRSGELPEGGNITFVLDPALQSLPTDFLHDGEGYLIQKYSMSVTLGSQMRKPRSLKPKEIKVLLAGVSDLAPSFSNQFAALSQTTAEIEHIQGSTTAKILLNQQFTAARLKQVLNQGNFPIVHFSTHGRFSSNPTETGILAWDKPIKMRDLRRIIETQNARDRSIELLVLSACESAKGDGRSILGLAGVAAQAGARSTIASLWLVDESSTVVLMDEFYRRLSGGMSKAEALRQAKLVLMESEDFKHPFFWGSFVLVGGWL
jgi:CHAT domain-containing protein